MKKKKLFIRSRALVCLLLILLSIGFLVWTQNLHHEIKEYEEMRSYYENMPEGYLNLTDDYDSDNSSFSDALTDKGFFSIEQEAYNRLRSCDKIVYYEVNQNPFYYVGTFKGSKDASYILSMVNEDI